MNVASASRRMRERLDWPAFRVVVHAVVTARLRERLRETEVIDAWSKIVGDFIAPHSAPVALREGLVYVRVL